MQFIAPIGTELVAPLARGSVFHAALVRAGDRVLVCKRLLPRARHEPAGRAAMAREGLALSRARHRSLPELIRVGSDAHGPFVIESRVVGVSLAALIEGWRARGSKVPARLVAHVCVEAVTALAELHELADDRGPIGLSHGDLGPAHVLLGPLGEARFVDLGAARFTGMDPALDVGDRGTLPYAAPEVARGEEPPGQAADVYALAATLLHLATGAPLIAEESDAAALLAVGERGLDPSLWMSIEALSVGARHALGRALALDPRDRPPSARALSIALAS